MRNIIAAVVFLPVLATTLISFQSATTTRMRHVSRRTPVQGSSRELAAERLAVPSAPRAGDLVGASANPWKLLATLPGVVIEDISFPTLLIGYAAAELGQVWKTTDGGVHWTQVMNVGFPYYWYGVKALSTKDVVISGFNDSSLQGVIRWSHDGGVTWTPDIVLTAAGWSGRIRFATQQNGLVLDLLSTAAANSAHVTTDGGPGVTDWTTIVPDPNGGWFGNQFSLLSNLHVRAAGITYCGSTDGGVQWKCRPSIDSIFDGAVFFLNDRYGWVGGGEISPGVEGWVHRTTDGGKTWSGRTLDNPWPIRELRFVNAKVGWAAGGNIYSNVGGIYFTSDGGQNWSLDLNTNGAEMKTCDSRSAGTTLRVVCAGYTGAFNSVVYSLRY
ncbi:MAG: YCF48-related protein [Bryobacteraceae bacterium]